MPKVTQPKRTLPSDPLWYRKAIIYQAHVRSYYDSDGNGIGDFRGLTQKLDYLRDLGVTCLWLLPFYASPLKDDGYDIADYYSINPIYGTLPDFKVLLREAHRRSLRVITELVVNHTSDQHEWFQKSRRAKPGSRWRNFYVWSDHPEKYKDARIIFKDFEHSNWTWDPVAEAYYWHRFYSHQPDLNYDSADVRKEVRKALDFWLDLGVDGLRLDAVPYLFEREGTNCENLAETHAFLKELRAHVDAKYCDRMLLAEANQWPEYAAAYFGQGRGDECHMAFHFPLMPRLFMAVRMEDRTPIVDILEQTPAIPETSQWAVFLRNHDELTLEMVTDEERDYMYRVYAQDTRARINLGIRRRLAPLLGSDRKRIELMNALLMSMPGTPVIYYGDEIGLGDNVFLGDRNGVRTPMQWSSDKNAGFSRANPQSLYLPIILDPEYHYEAVNVEAQERNPHSLLRWMQRLLALRKKWHAFGLGAVEFLQPENRKILAFVRRYEQECVLVVCNLSRFVQPVELDLSAYQQMVPRELFGRTDFPPILDKPYLLTLGPHAFYWFSLVPRTVESVQVATPVAPSPTPLGKTLSVAERWEEVLREPVCSELVPVLQGYIQPRRWFGGKAREVKGVTVRETIPVPVDSGRAFVLLLDVDYVQGDPETYDLPVAFAEGPEAEAMQRDCPHLIICEIRVGQSPVTGVLHDAVGSKAFSRTLFEAIARRRGFRGERGQIEAQCTPALRTIRDSAPGPLEPVLGRAEQSNSAVVFGERLFLKLFRRIEQGENPDVEIGRFLSKQSFPHVSPQAGSLRYRTRKGEECTLAVLNGYVPICKDGWEYTLDALGRFYDRMCSLPDDCAAPRLEEPVADLAEKPVPELVQQHLGTYAESARLLGDRTAALHLALASDKEDKDFKPEPFNPFYQRSLYQSMRNQLVQNFSLLRKRLKNLPADVLAEAQRVGSLEAEVLKRFRAVADLRLTGTRTRVHGDYHLGQVLHTGKDFIIIDFEGEPARPLTERRIKRTPLRDVAGMLRSFHYASYAFLYQQMEQGLIDSEKLARLDPWAQFWSHWVSTVFLQAYLALARQGDFLPKTPGELKTLLEANLLNKAVYEVGYEMNNRPHWLKIPLQGISHLLAGMK